MSLEEEKSCRYFHELISYEMDGQANEEEQYELAKHLLVCVDCQITQERYKETDELGKKLAKVFPMEYFKMKPEDFQVPDDIPKGTEEYKNWEKMIKEILEEDQKKRERLERLKKKYGKDPLKMTDEELFGDDEDELSEDHKTLK